jgi:hypothetical protein
MQNLKYWNVIINIIAITANIIVLLVLIPENQDLIIFEINPKN